jgi:hypothetical protein
LIREVLVSIGSLSTSVVHPREVFAPAVRDSSAAWFSCITILPVTRPQAGRQRMHTASDSCGSDSGNPSPGPYCSRA